MIINEFDLLFDSTAWGEQPVYFWACVSSPGIVNDMGGITLIPISINLGQPCTVDEHAPCPPPGNQAQEVQLPAASKPKRTGSLALFYRKVSVLTQKCCCTCARGRAESCLPVQLPLPPVFMCLSLGMCRSYIPWRRRERMLSVAECPVFAFPPMRFFFLFN